MPQIEVLTQSWRVLIKISFEKLLFEISGCKRSDQILFELNMASNILWEIMAELRG